MFAYAGPLTHNIMLGLLSMTEKNLEVEESDQSLRNKMFRVMVECIQNITLTSSRAALDKSPLLIIGREPGGYKLYIGNFIPTEQVYGIKSSLLKINMMSKEELKEFSMMIIREHNLLSSQDASLGLIDIAKQTGNQLDFEFEPLSDDTYFFAFEVSIRNQEEPGPADRPDRETREHFNLLDFYNFLAMSDIVLIYEGRFSQDVTKSMLGFMEKKLISEEVEDALRRKVFNVTVEILQNLSKHQNPDITTGSSLPSSFIIGHSNQEFVLVSGNPIPNDKIPPLRKRIDHINSLDQEGLKMMYKEIRLKGSFSEVGGAGIGLVDIARKSKNQIGYRFTPIDDALSFFTLVARINKELNSTNKNTS